MNPRRRRVRIVVAIGLIAGLLLVTIGTVIEAIAARSIEGQEGWSGGTIPVSASIDQIVDQSGLNQRTGTGAWRISNNTSLGNYNGDFPGWPFGPGLPVSAGQPLSGAGADQFTATLWFRSASASADGSNIEIDLGTEPGDDRNTFLALTNRADADGGLQLRAGEPDGATGDFRPTQIIAPGITRSVWHRLDIVAKFLDGPANDTVAYALDGSLHSPIPPAAPRSAPSRPSSTARMPPPLRPEQPPVLPLGRSPECLWRIRRHGRPGLLLRRPVLRRRGPVGTGPPAGRLRDGVRAGLHRRFDPEPGRLVRRNDPDRRDRRSGRRPIRSQPTHRDGSLADLEQHFIGQPQRGLLRVGVRPGPPGVRWPAVIRGRRRSVHRDAVVPLREYGRRWLQHRDRSRDRPRR